MKLHPKCRNYQEPLFIFRDRTALKPNNLRVVQKNSIKRIGLHKSLYDTHSLRSGKAVDMAKERQEIEKIKLAGRWRSNATYDYLRENQC